MIIFKYIFLVLFLLNSNQLKAENRDNKLNELFNDLKINNKDLAYSVEQKIWDLWSTHPTNNKLTIKSGNVKRTTATSVSAFAPEIDDSNHSLIKPAILPIKMKEATTIVEFFIDNF